MTNRWIASYDCLTISDDTLEHYGRIGMKWYQHIFGKTSSGAYTQKKRDKMSKKYGVQKAALKEAKSIKNAYNTARAVAMQKNQHQYDESDRKEYKDEIKKVLIRNTSDKKTIMKNLILAKNFNEEIDKAYTELFKDKNLFTETEDYGGIKAKMLNEKGEKKLLEMTKEAYDMHLNAIKEWTKDLFGTDLNGISKKDYEESGASFVSQMSTKDLEEMYDRYAYLEYLTK